MTIAWLQCFKFATIGYCIVQGVPQNLRVEIGLECRLWLKKIIC